MNFVDVHRNIPQMLFFTIWAKITILLWGRGTGKSVTMPTWIIENISEMPGCVGAVGTDSYKHLRKQIIPEFKRQWRIMGLAEGRDYWIDKFPPKHLGIPEALRPPAVCENHIFFRNGSVVKFFSFNFQALENGDSIDFLGIEEGKQVKPSRVNEILPCLRGNEDAEWAGKSCNKSVLIVSDMPDEVEGYYLLDFDDMMKPDLIDRIANMKAVITLAEEELEAGKVDRKDKSEFVKKLEYLKSKLNDYRKDAVYVSYASTLENLHALGLDVFANLKKSIRSLSKFRSSVMNELPQQIKDCFYHLLSKEKHGYVALNKDYITSLDDKTKDDCRWDTDTPSNENLRMGMDYNAAICCAVIGTYDEYNKDLKFIKNFWADVDEDKIKDRKVLRALMKKIIKYYKPLEYKVIDYYYDSTALVTGPDSGYDYVNKEKNTSKSIVVSMLQEAGWTVIEHQIVQAGFRDRFEDWENDLSDDELANSKFSFNIENCSEWYFSATHTKTKFQYRVTKNGEPYKEFVKDKSSEQKDNIRRIQATHINEAGDTLKQGIKQQYNQAFIYVG